MIPVKASLTPMQRPQSLKLNPSQVESSLLSLRFPTIPVDGTPTSWESRSETVAMVFTHDESGDDTTSSLGDSSYDFVEDQSNVTTDDEDQDAMAESINSSDGHAFEQVDLEAHGHYGTEQNSLDPRPTISQNQQGLTQFEQDPTEKATAPVDLDHSAPHEHESIEFDESSITNLNFTKLTEVSHTLQIIEKQNCSHQFHRTLLNRFHGQLAVSVRQTMTSKSIIPKDGQYKIMYVGDLGARGPILQKIGMALATSLKTSSPESRTPGMSKFNVIPISAFGEEHSPVVLIDASGLEMIVEDCVRASFAQKEGGNDLIQLEMSGGANVDSSWNGFRFTTSSNWRLPDLAIFYQPDIDDFTSKRTRQLARSFMSRHKVLTIIISQSVTWDKPPMEPVPLDYLTPHICLESRTNPVQAHVIRRYPIDLATFLNIDAGQMNRNLACLTTSRLPSKSNRHDEVALERVKRRSTHSPWSCKELIESMVSDVQKDGLRGLNRHGSFFGLVLGLISIIVVVVFGLSPSGFLTASRVSTSRIFPTNVRGHSISEVTNSTVSLSAAAAPNMTSTLISQSSSSTPARMIPTKGLSANTDLASLFDAYTLAPNKSDQFKVHVLGDCHVILRPPHWLTKMKRSPKLSFKILRGEVELDHQETALFDGVYALQVPREHAHGLLNLAVRTETKPVVTENFEVNFGTSWLNVAGWRKKSHSMIKSLQGDFDLVQTKLSIAYDYTKTSLSTFVRQPQRIVTAQHSSERAIFRFHLEAVNEAKDLVLTHTKNLQRMFSRRFLSSRTSPTARIAMTAEQTSKSLILYTRSRADIFLQQAHNLPTISDLKRLLGKYGDFREEYLRATQKRALKAWWSVRGAPQHTIVETGMMNKSPEHHEM